MSFLDNKLLVVSDDEERPADTVVVRIDSQLLAFEISEDGDLPVDVTYSPLLSKVAHESVRVPIDTDPATVHKSFVVFWPAMLTTPNASTVVISTLLLPVHLLFAAIATILNHEC